MPDAAVRITEINQRAVVRLKSYLLASRPTPSLWEGAGKGEARLLTLGPAEWWVVSDILTGTQLCERLRNDLDKREIAIVDLSCALRTLRFEGPVTRDFVAKGCGLDLYPRYFRPGSATRTRFAQLQVTLECLAPSPRFELYVGRSYFAWLRSWLDDAAIEFQHSSG